MPSQTGAIQDVCRAHEAQLAEYLTRMVGSPEVARKVSQVTFAHVQERYAHRRVLFPRALLFKIATLIAVTYLQRRRLASAADLGALTVDESAIGGAGGDEAGQPSDPERIGPCLAEAIKGLRPSLRQVFVMAHVEGKCRNELVAALAISERCLDKRLAKALRACRERLLARGIDLVEIA